MWAIREIIDAIAITLSFLAAIGIKYKVLVATFGSTLIVSTYCLYFSYALILYMFIFLLRRKPRIDRQSYKEIITMTIEQQIVFAVAYIVMFFVFHTELVISRMVVGLFFIGNVVLCSIGRMLYHNYCAYRTRKISDRVANCEVDIKEVEGIASSNVQHV